METHYHITTFNFSLRGVIPQSVNRDVLKVVKVNVDGILKVESVILETDSGLLSLVSNMNPICRVVRLAPSHFSQHLTT